MYFITIKRMLEVCFSAHPNIQYRANKENDQGNVLLIVFLRKDNLKLSKEGKRLED